MYIKFDENGNYGFYTPEIHGEEFCENECIKITDEFYNFLMQNNGEYLIEVNSVIDTVTKDNLVERVVAPVEIDETPTDKERLQVLEQAMLELILGGVK